MSAFSEIIYSAASNEIQVADLPITDNLWSLKDRINHTQILNAELLTDPTRLNEIYNLRLSVWESSGKNDFVNRQLYPDGWYDELDEAAFHWIVKDPLDNIIASARLNIFNSMEEFPYHESIKHLSFPNENPFGFYSRLVVHPDYRQNGLSRQLFTQRAQFCKENGVGWSQVFINNPQIIHQFEKSGYTWIGEAEISYHPSSEPHSVNVFIKENGNP